MFAIGVRGAGVSPYVVKDLLGHSSITVTERHAHLAPHMGREAVRMLRAQVGALTTGLRFYVK
ncbi:integrase [Burkholderia sp. Bp9126]|nr:integrase [Burkholderia sp. Bp9126]